MRKFKACFALPTENIELVQNDKTISRIIVYYHENNNSTAVKNEEWIQRFSCFPWVNLSCQNCTHIFYIQLSIYCISDTFDWPFTWWHCSETSLETRLTGTCTCRSRLNWDSAKKHPRLHNQLLKILHKFVI
jgi:hypothetical protein